MFVQAGSIKIEDAINLRDRPFLHNSTLPLSVYIIVMFFNCSVMENQAFIKTYSTLIFVAFFSHHLRDASRRGLWFSPWIQSLPISYPMYIFMIILLCLIIRFVLFEKFILSLSSSSPQMKLPVTIHTIWTNCALYFFEIFSKLVIEENKSLPKRAL